jgi:hypothetical protein
MKTEEEKNKLAIITTLGAGALYLIERSRRRYNEAHYKRRMQLLQAKNDALRKYVFDEVQNPEAALNLIVDARFIDIVDKNNLQ